MEERLARQVEAQIYAYHAELCKVLSHSKRLQIINVLRDGEMGAGELCRALEVTPANLSQHLALMKERRLVASRKEGNLVYYRLRNLKLLEAFDILRQVLFEQIKQDAALLKDSG